MRQLAFLVVIGLCLSVPSFAQSFKQPDIIPPSPEAANLDKVVKIPVSYNTGIPQIGIPLYTIVVNNLQHPISLSYHSGGIKVDEVASWVGLGWTLTANGAITRVMKGRPDESSTGFFNKGQWNTWQDMKTWVTGNPQMGQNGQAEQRHNFQMAVANGAIDLEPDIFSFNFGGYSGQIYFDVDKNPVIVPFQDLKISHPFTSGGTQWVITTPEGIEYVFKNSDAEVTTPLNEGSAQPPFYSTWHLSEIRSLTQPGFIQFYYVGASLNGIETTPSSGVVLGKLDYSDTTCVADPPYPQGMGSNTYSISLKYLDNIQFTNGSIKFNSTADRNDKYQNVTYTGRKLNSMVVSAPGMTHVKTVTFGYGYASERLMLQSVQETGKSPYQFQYNTGTLPPVTSYARDHWGYYNGKVTNQSLIPAMTKEQESFFRKTSDYLQFAKANREPSASSALAGSLTKIIYPTGGERRLNFESNVVYGTFPKTLGGGIAATGATLNQSMNTHEQGQYNYFIQQQYSYLGGPINVRSGEFTLTHDAWVEFSFNAQISGPGSIGDIAQVHVYKGPTVNYNTPVAFNLNGLKFLTAGTYIMIAAASQSGVTVSGYVTYEQNVAGNYKVGGLRVASIEDYDNNQLVERMVFKYTVPLGVPAAPQAFLTTPPQAIELRSSAEMFDLPVYSKVTNCGRLYLSANDVSSTTMGRGFHVGYKQVEVFNTAGIIDEEDPNPELSTNGSTMFFYKNNINTHLRDLVEKEVYLDAYRDTVKTVKYGYNYEACFSSGTRCDFSSAAVGISMQLAKHWLTCAGSGQNCTVDYYTFDVKQSSYNTFWIYQNRVTEKLFSRAIKTDYMLSVKSITSGKEVIGSYENSHTLPVETSVTQQNGEKLIEKFIHSPGVVSGMVVKAPIKHHFIREIGGQKYLTHSLFYSYTNSLLTAIDAFETSSPPLYTDNMTITYTPKLTQTYAAQKIATRVTPNGPVASYIWDLKLMNPIAEVVNSGGKAVAFTSFENGSSEGNWTYTANTNSANKTGSQSHSFVTSQNITRTGLTSATTYKVTYWAKNGVPTVSNVTASNDAAAADAQGWKYYEKTITGTTTVTISAAAGTLIDELRLYPAGAQMKTLTYKPLTGISSVTDANNQMQYYIYDAAGRLQMVKDYNGNVVQYQDYHYKN